MFKVPVGESEVLLRLLYLINQLSSGGLGCNIWHWTKRWLCPNCLFTASENCHDFHPMFFTHDRSFEEFFCICIQLLNKTWKEMRATSEDFNKVRAALLIESLHPCLILHQSPSSSGQPIWVFDWPMIQKFQESITISVKLRDHS